MMSRPDGIVLEEPMPPQAGGPPAVPVLVSPSIGGIGEWRVMEFPGGWLRWSKKLSRGDAHCRCHLGKPECKMDRVLVKGSISASVVWLARGLIDPDRQSHQMDKSIVASVECFDERLENRNNLERMALTNPELAELLQAEADARGGSRDEPLRIP